MSALVVGETGPLTSVQDAGRFGAQRYGLAPSGAMDRDALASANALAGQPPGAAAIEIGPFGARLVARGGVYVGLAGAEREALVDSRAIAMNSGLWLDDGATLTLKVARGALFSYVAVAGGLSGEPMFGSLSVNARAGLGSPYPRPLGPGDVLEINAPASPWNPVARSLPRERGEGPIRVVLGPQDDYFDAAALDLFLTSEWRVSPQSDRMGYRLDGPRLSHARGANIVSDGTVTGHIQVPGNGQPLVLMPDRGTTGGYPKIATIIGADLGRFAQTPPGGAVRFRSVTVAEAQDAARRHAADLAALAQRVVVAGAPSLEALMSGNLAGQAVSALDAATWQDVAPGPVPGSGGKS
ncbi:MAG: biotin-dependent carboxyltransferase [Xanthobacteraceae bacterium]|nr:MAG: biotin-dependent carboxyltransferase [Xanthobacteraceae bacterium]